MYEKLRKIREERAEGDRGFTLIELLVVVVIIGILVAIAIPIYLNYEHGSQNRSAQSDARNSVAAIEQCKADNGGNLPASANDGTTTGSDVTLAGCSPTETIVVSPGNTLAYTNNADGTYSVAVTAATGTTYTYESSTGKVA